MVDEQPKRRARDGKCYTLAEFREFYGWHAGGAFWESAGQLEKQTPAPMEGRDEAGTASSRVSTSASWKEMPLRSPVEEAKLIAAFERYTKSGANACLALADDRCLRRSMRPLAVAGASGVAEIGGASPLPKPEASLTMARVPDTAIVAPPGLSLPTESTARHTGCAGRGVQQTAVGCIGSALPAEPKASQTGGAPIHCSAGFALAAGQVQQCECAAPTAAAVRAAARILAEFYPERAAADAWLRSLTEAPSAAEAGLAAAASAPPAVPLQSAGEVPSPSASASATEHACSAVADVRAAAREEPTTSACPVFPACEFDNPVVPRYLVLKPVCGMLPDGLVQCLIAVENDAFRGLEANQDVSWNEEIEEFYSWVQDHRVYTNKLELFSAMLTRYQHYVAKALEFRQKDKIEDAEHQAELCETLASYVAEIANGFARRLPLDDCPVDRWVTRTFALEPGMEVRFVNPKEFETKREGTARELKDSTTEWLPLRKASTPVTPLSCARDETATAAAPVAKTETSPLGVSWPGAAFGPPPGLSLARASALEHAGSVVASADGEATPAPPSPPPQRLKRAVPPPPSPTLPVPGGSAGRAAKKEDVRPQCPPAPSSSDPWPAAKESALAASDATVAAKASVSGDTNGGGASEQGELVLRRSLVSREDLPALRATSKARLASVNSLHEEARAMLNELANGEEGPAVDLQQRWPTWREYIASHKQASDTVGMGIVAFTAERIAGTSDPNRHGKKRLGFFARRTDGSAYRLHPGQRRALDAKPRYMPPSVLQSTRDETMLLGNTLAELQAIPQSDCYGKDYAFNKLLELECEPGTDLTDQEKFAWPLFFANLGRLSRKVVGQRITKVTLILREENKIILEVSNSDGVVLVHVRRYEGRHGMEVKLSIE